MFKGKDITIGKITALMSSFVALADLRDCKTRPQSFNIHDMA